MGRIAEVSFLRRRTAEKIKAQIVTHDSSQQLRIRSGTKLRMLLRRIQRWLDRVPVRHPERAHSAALLKDLGNMAAANEHGDTQILILNRDRFPALEDRLWHSQLSQRADCTSLQLRLPTAVSLQTSGPHRLHIPWRARRGRLALLAYLRQSPQI